MVNVTKYLGDKQCHIIHSHTGRHFLTNKGRTQKSNAFQPLPHSPSPSPRRRRGGAAARGATAARRRQNEYSPSATRFPVRGGGRILILSPPRCPCRRRSSGGDGVGHKNACLNKNVILAHLPQQERLFCLLPSRLGLRPRLSGRRQKSCSC